MAEVSTIKVTGAGHVSMAPDKTVIAFEIAFEDEDYAKAVSTVDHHVGRLRMGLRDAGVDPDLLKTQRLSVEPNHEWQGNGDARAQVFVGWNASQNLRLELGVDRTVLNNAMKAIASCGAASEVDLSFEIGDQATFRTKVLADATRMAFLNARTIAEAAGCKLGKPLKIKYGWSEMSWRSPTIFADRELMCRESAPDIRPADVQGSDTVTILFALE